MTYQNSNVLSGIGLQSCLWQDETPRVICLGDRVRIGRRSTVPRGKADIIRRIRVIPLQHLPCAQLNTLRSVSRSFLKTDSRWRRVTGDLQKEATARAVPSCFKSVMVPLEATPEEDWDRNTSKQDYLGPCDGMRAEGDGYSRERYRHACALAVSKCTRSTFSGTSHGARIRIGHKTAPIGWTAWWRKSSHMEGRYIEGLDPV